LILFSLEEYPVQASIGVETYVVGGLLTVILALTTAAYHVVAAARANPVEALKYE
jgi:ABC-type antimicrobial peptide transport system permease subunit